MKKKPKKIQELQVPRNVAIKIAMNHNSIPEHIANKYTDSELKEVLHHIRPEYKYYITPTEEVYPSKINHKTPTNL